MDEDSNSALILVFQTGEEESDGEIGAKGGIENITGRCTHSHLCLMLKETNCFLPKYTTFDLLHSNVR